VFEAPNMGIKPYHHADDVSPDDRRFLMISWFEEVRVRR